MFIVIDTTEKMPYRTATDIVLGITGEDEDYDQALYIMSGMKWGDAFSNDRFAILCYNETLEKKI